MFQRHFEEIPPALAWFAGERHRGLCAPVCEETQFDDKPKVQVFSGVFQVSGTDTAKFLSPSFSETIYTSLASPPVCV